MSEAHAPSCIHVRYHGCHGRGATLTPLEFYVATCTVTIFKRADSVAVGPGP